MFLEISLNILSLIIALAAALFTVILTYVFQFSRDLKATILNVLITLREEKSNIISKNDILKENEIDNIDGKYDLDTANQIIHLAMRLYSEFDVVSECFSIKTYETIGTYYLTLSDYAEERIDTKIYKKIEDQKINYYYYIVAREFINYMELTLVDASTTSAIHLFIRYIFLQLYNSIRNNKTKKLREKKNETDLEQLVDDVIYISNLKCFSSIEEIKQQFFIYSPYKKFFSIFRFLNYKHILSLTKLSFEFMRNNYNDYVPEESRPKNFQQYTNMLKEFNVQFDEIFLKCKKYKKIKRKKLEDK